MAKKKKKSKAQLEKERLEAEEAERVAEQERLKAEEEERIWQEQDEQRRQELLVELRGRQIERLAAETEELAPFLGRQKQERLRAAEQRQKDWDWERYLACTHVPHPRDRVAFADYLRLMHEQQDTDLSETLTACQDCYCMLSEVRLFEQQSRLELNDDAEAMHKGDVAELHKAVGLRLDRITAHMLQHSDEFASDKGEVQQGMQKGGFDLAVWVNTSKNPRLKVVELESLQMVVEIPKQIALANLAMRVQHRGQDEFFATCTNDLMAVGGVLYADLLALPPPSKQVKAWVLRQITPLSSSIAKIPYPIPPAGADPLTWKAEEEPPALGFAMPFDGHSSLVLEEQPQVGWWDAEAQGWSGVGVSDVVLDAEARTLSFHSTHAGPLALVQSRVRLLPYRFWSCRPTGGCGGSKAAVTLNVDALPDPIVFEVGAGYASLKAPALDPLAPLMGKQLPPEQLLLALSSLGLHLLPEDRDAHFAGVTLKDRNCERGMCDDLAMISSTFLIARSKWNQAAGTPKECIARISEVTDWDAGGRTELHHLQRIFTKEKEEGERRVLTLMRRGTWGLAFVDALDKHEHYNKLPGSDTADSVQACMDTVWGEVHANPLALLKGVVPKANDLPPAAEGSQPTDPKDLPLVMRLSACAQTLDLVQGADVLMTQTVAQLLMLLRVFSFS